MLAGLKETLPEVMSFPLSLTVPWTVASVVEVVAEGDPHPTPRAATLAQADARSTPHRNCRIIVLLLKPTGLKVWGALALSKTFDDPPQRPVNRHPEPARG